MSIEMNYKITIVLFILFFVIQNQAQEVKKKNIIDVVPSLSLDPEFQNFIFNPNFNKIPNFNGYTYSGIFMQSRLNFKASRFAHFDICLNEGLKYGLEEQYKYDLGIIGEYLGITKNAAAILIGILSLL